MKTIKLYLTEGVKTYKSNSAKYLFNKIVQNREDLYRHDNADCYFEADLLDAIDSMELSNYDSVCEDYRDELDTIDKLVSDINENSTDDTDEEYENRHKALIKAIKKFLKHTYLKHNYIIEDILEQDKFTDVEYISDKFE